MKFNGLGPPLGIDGNAAFWFSFCRMKQERIPGARTQLAALAISRAGQLGFPSPEPHSSRHSGEGQLSCESGAVKSGSQVQLSPHAA